MVGGRLNGLGAVAGLGNAGRTALLMFSSGV